MRAVGRALLAIVGIVGLILLYNVGLFTVEGRPYIPTVEKRWWAGYYDTTHIGRQWCLALFERVSTDRVRLALVSRTGRPDIFTGDRESSDRTFVTFDLKDTSGLLRIQAKQLYEGKRYPLQRLLVGRFGDFWQLNEDLAIRGEFVTAAGAHEFAIEPLPADRVNAFWRRDVQRVDGQQPLDLILAAGFQNPDSVR